MLGYAGKNFSSKRLMPAYRKKGVRGAMQHVEMVSVAGGSLWTVRQGHGPALDCCHGGSGLWDYLEPLAALLDGPGTLWRHDQRPCGRSPGGPPPHLSPPGPYLVALGEP